MPRGYIFVRHQHQNGLAIYSQYSFRSFLLMCSSKTGYDVQKRIQLPLSASITRYSIRSHHNRILVSPFLLFFHIFISLQVELQISMITFGHNILSYLLKSGVLTFSIGPSEIICQKVASRPLNSGCRFNPNAFPLKIGLASIKSLAQ